MGKRAYIIILIVGLLAAGSATSFGIWKIANQRLFFQNAGSVLLGESEEDKQVDFPADASYLVSRNGYVSFEDTDGHRTSVEKESFVLLGEDSFMALADGALLDFKDMSENFINNYYITSGLSITKNGGAYTAQTATGPVEFGENVWKLSDQKYLIQSPALSVHFSDEDVRETEDYVQVATSKDGIVHILTKENLWSTISEDCYVETEGGVQIYPLTQIMDNGNYKMSLAKLAVSPDDAIVLTEDETRRQIVPELNIEAVDGEDGADGEEGAQGEAGAAGGIGISGQQGEQGEQGQQGQQGEQGKQGEQGEQGQQGDQGSQGSNGSTGSSGRDGGSGSSGRTGTSGAAGAAGSQGSSGASGAIGTSGAAGASGQAGAAGSAGAAGASGQAGAAGASGAAGAAGASGESGATGTSGESGATGTSGESGATGVTGATGTNGAAGVSGETGVSGTDGNSGTDGTNGQDGGSGQNAAAGVSGTEGEDGANGNDGDDGEAGKKGVKGNSAVVSSSTNTSLPSMAFTEWEVSATSLSGVLAVSDENEHLILGESTEKYPDQITIYKASTGEKVCTCLVLPNQSELDFSAGTDNFATLVSEGADKVEIAFTVPSDKQLEPDTEYRVSVTAYYVMTTSGSTGGGSSTIYSREFLSRRFYTDSTGALLSAQPSLSNAVAAELSISDAYRSSVKQATLILLTKADNERLNKGIAYSTVDTYTLDYATVQKYPATVVFRGDAVSKVEYEDEDPIYKDNVKIEPNTEYVIRVRVKGVTETGDEYEKITNQELPVTSLKREPEYSETEKTRAYFNRTTGAFEIYRINVSDQDSGAVRYIYKAYLVGSDGVASTEPTYTQYVTPEDSGSAAFYLSNGTSFYLESNKQYSFGVEMEFFDNEKTVLYPLGGLSEPVVAVGGTLPGLSLEHGKYTEKKDGTETEYQSSYPESNAYQGTLKIESSGSTSISKIDASHPMTLEVLRDQMTFLTFTLPDDDGKSQPENASDTDLMGVVNLITNEDNSKQISLKFNNLYKNSNYTINVNGYVNYNDGNGVLKQNLGRVSFKTLDTTGLTASWSKLDSATSALAVNLKLSPSDPNRGSADTTAREIYAEEQLKQGQVTLKLYQGTGTSRMLMTTKYLSSEEDLQALYGANGLDITEKKLDAGVDAGRDYTLEVSEAADHTVKDYDYTNTYEISNATYVMTTQAAPPAFLTDPSKGVTATPILNKNAATYGGVVDQMLSGDAIVGYYLQAEYDNSQRMGSDITYYAFEYSNFYSTLVNAGKNPLEEARVDMNSGNGQTVIKPISFAFDESTTADLDYAPGLVLLFGDKSKGEAGLSDEVWHGIVTMEDNTKRMFHTYYAGEAKFNTAGGILEGMGRGYRYLFAYTATYLPKADSSTTPILYPDGITAQYEEYKKTYGAGRVSSRVTALGAGTAYILNSGMCSAPRVQPEFHSYIYDTTSEWSDIRYNGSGRAVIHYAFRDIDGTINNQTTVSFGANNSMSQALISNDLVATAGDGSGLTWYSLTVPYTASTDAMNNMFAPEVSVQEYATDNVNYNPILINLGLAEDVAQTQELCRFSTEPGWNLYWADSTTASAVFVEVEENYGLNYMDFRLTDSNTGYAKMLGKRAYAMKLDFTRTEDNKTYTAWVEISGDENTGYYARLSTNQIQDLLKKAYTVTASLYYDNGYQGWKLLDTGGNSFNSEGLFAVQYANQQEDQNEFYLGDYAVNSTSVSAKGSTPSGALVSLDGSFSALNLRALTNADTNDSRASRLTDTPAAFSFTGKVGSWAYARGVYPDDMGVRGGDTDVSVANLGSRFITLKGASAYTLNLRKSGDTANPTSQYDSNLSKITPLVNFDPDKQTEASNSKIRLLDFTVDGVVQEGSENPVVHAAIYDTESHAQALGDAGRQGAVKNFELEVDKNTGKTNIVVDGESSPGDFDGLTAGKTYYLVFYMDLGDGNTILIKSKDNASSQAIYEVSTETKVVFTNPQILYTNTGYFAKSVKLEFGMNRSINMLVKCDIVTSDDGENVKETILDYDTMKRNNMLINTLDNLTRSNNTVTINLEPSINRKKVVPGGTYYLRLQAFENGSTNPLEAEDYLHAFTIPATEDFSAVVQVVDAGMNKTDVNGNEIEEFKGKYIQWSVAPMGEKESNFSYMGQKNYQSGAGLYAVRFTDSAYNWIPSEYDGKVYKVSDGAQLFTLSGKTVASSDPNNTAAIAIGNTTPSDGMYRLLVYAVKDVDHDGLNDVAVTANGSSAQRSWEYFFGNAATPTETDVGSTFKSFLDSFWGNTLNNGETASGTKKYGYDHIGKELSSEESYFVIGNSLQELVNEQGFYAEGGYAIFLGSNRKTFTLLVPNSYGFDTAIKKIEYQITPRNSTAVVSGTVDVANQLFEAYMDDEYGHSSRLSFTVDGLPRSIFYNVIIKAYTSTAEGTPAAMTFEQRVSGVS